ncbi:hypothetical protein AB0B45_12905 [Nonomuraea sp. NPDC049152]|uniref:hypothetical protein n=1 Tax=Nonomuraea sp. NPDC049152 TaxID=3154350 RepID=UPI0033F20AB7
MPTTLNPQIVGQAENAHKPLLDRVLSRTGTTKHQWVALKLTALSGGTIDRAQLIGRITGALKIPDAAALAALTELTAAHLLQVQPGEAPTIELTPAGQERHREIGSAIDEIIARVYGDIPPGDLETAGRVLTLITARLNAEN